MAGRLNGELVGWLFGSLAVWSGPFLAWTGKQNAAREIFQFSMNSNFCCCCFYCCWLSGGTVPHMLQTNETNKNLNKMFIRICYSAMVLCVCVCVCVYFYSGGHANTNI